RGYGEEPVKQEPSKAEEVKEELSETYHALMINGEAIRYKASAGTMLLKDEKQKPKAAVFYIAYTKEGVEDVSNRPITFCFNGGPGSSAVWLHLGVLGPKRVDLTDDGYSLPPYRVLNNEHSLLDVTDLVFIDPVSTGYSRAVSDEDPKKFHGVDGDIKSVAEFIRLYVTRNLRWGSPKFLAGESYGTTRAAGLAGHLQDEHRMYLNGVMLVSSVLNYQTLWDDQGGNDLPYLLFLPTFSSTAWYHKKLPPDLQEKSLKAVLAEVEDFAINEYSLALLKGEKLSERERLEMVRKLARYTGLSLEYIKRANLRIDIHRYCKELLREEERTVGRFDSRQKGIESDLCGEHIENDPSLDAIMGGFTAAFNQYVRGELKWEKDEPYKVLTREVWPWDFGTAKSTFLNVSETLRDAMTRNPELKVFVGSGYYDLATPYFATDYTFNHLGLDSSLLGHVTMEYYDAGHMSYTHLPSLKKMKEDLSKFIKASVKQKNS
ncbi:MAG: S10 family peptidase, partial [Waddliaceae bacterium]